MSSRLGYLRMNYSPLWVLLLSMITFSIIMRPIFLRAGSSLKNHLAHEIVLYVKTYPTSWLFSEPMWLSLLLHVFLETGLEKLLLIVNIRSHSIYYFHIMWCCVQIQALLFAHIIANRSVRARISHDHSIVGFDELTKNCCPHISF